MTAALTHYGLFLGLPAGNLWGSDLLPAMFAAVVGLTLGVGLIASGCALGNALQAGARG